MSDINITVISCVIDSDPDVCSFPNGKKVFQCRILGPGMPYKDNELGVWRRRPMWLEMKAWNRGNGKLADLCEKRLQHGSKIIVHGTLVTEEWIEGSNKRSRVVLDAKEIEFL